MSDYINSVNKYCMIFFFVLLSLLTGCRGRAINDDISSTSSINPPINMPGLIEQYPEFSRSSDIESTYDPIAESPSLRLYLDPKTSSIIVEDLRQGTLWRSSPEDLETNENTTQAWRSQIALPIQISYVDAARSQQKNIKPEEINISYQPVENGTRVTYDIENKNLTFDVFYTLNQDCLEATIPTSSVIESGDNNFVSVDLLAFLGATHDGDHGYIIFPDGSGALMDFETPHPPEVQKILSTIYGVDDVSDRGSVYQEKIVIPMFGLVKNQSGFVGIITQGDFDAVLGVARSGKGVDYNHVWAQFLYRRQGQFSLTGGQPTRLYQPDRIPGDRQVRYCFINNEKANYVEMASRYRQYLLEERGAQRVEERRGDDIPLIDLIYFMGIERKNWFLADMVVMTRFEDVAQMMSDFNKMGVKKADVSIWNWNESGTSNKYPQQWPVDKRLDGEEGLHKLIDISHQLGYKIYLVDDFLSVYPGTHTIQPFLDAVRGVDGLPAGNTETGYLLNPQVALREFAIPNLTKIASLGCDGLLFNSFADIALPDKNTRYPLTRENFAATWMQIAELSREEMGSSSMIGGNVYTIPYTDRLDMVSMDSTHYDIFDRTIPLFQISAHGLIVYSGVPQNFLSDSQRMFLHNIEYGAIPIFMLTRESSSLLFRTGANSIYSSRYDYWRDEIIRQYQAMESLAPLVSQFIIGHEQLADGVYRTSYEDGSQTIVNYNAIPFTMDSINVPPQDFIVVGGN
jgi:hypothetical protein